MERLVLTIITSIIMPIIVAVLILMAVQSMVGEIENLFTAQGGYYEKINGNSDSRGILRDND